MSAPERAGGPARTRLTAAAAAGGTVVLGLGARAAGDGAPAELAGDALYAVLVYALVVLAAPRLRPAVVAVTALGICWAIEFAQLSGVTAELARQSLLARLVLGSTFNPPDLFWYAFGAAVGLLVHAAVDSRRTTAEG